MMNDASHQMNAVTTFPYYTLEGWEMNALNPSEMSIKRSTVIGNDSWNSRNAVILPGVHISDGAIIGVNSSDVVLYTIVIGNPTKILRNHFDDEPIGLLLKFKWWDISVEEINSLIPILTYSDLEKVREEIEATL